MRFLRELSFMLITIFSTSPAFSQPERWQQRAEYVMDIDVNINTHQIQGKQQLKYFNNSPDTLDKVFYHLYFNAFQPGSSMDVRSRTIEDPDRRVGDRISKLKENEQGWYKINSLTCNGQSVNFEMNETILEVTLSQPILPHSTAVLVMDYQSQIPIQIRRSGRDSRDGISYTMTQWYPKLCEYDYQGWHANPYIGREFYGVWGDFKVNITIDKKYVVAASGYLENASQIGMGYEKAGETVIPPSGEKLTWQWSAQNVHDFAWAADPDYKHVKVERADGLTMHFFYEDKENIRGTWEKMPAIMDKVFDYANTHFGRYPYKSYAFIEGGDGGMEYPMATMLAGGAGPGTFIHELMHAWYYGLLGTNESLYSWMDEGFTEYATEEIENYLRKEKLLAGDWKEFPHDNNNLNYVRYQTSGYMEPLSTHADHFNRNRAYGTSAYVGGHVFLTQMNYILGKDVFQKALLRYFDTWKFKHPNPNDFIRIMEKTSGLELDWFKEYFVYTTKTIDYGIKSVEKQSRKETKIVIEKLGLMPMPVDLFVTFKNGKTEVFNIPLELMRGAKHSEFKDARYTVLKDWHWVNPAYEFTLNERLRDIVKIEIDPTLRLLDTDRSNNKWEQQGTDETDNEEKE